MSCCKSLLALICVFLHHLLIQKLHALSEKTQTIYLLDGNKITHGSDLPVQWLEC